MTYLADVNELALSIFGGVVAVTLVVTYFASKRVSTATDFWAAGRALTGIQNGFAIAGDYMSAASFLGIAGLIFLNWNRRSRQLRCSPGQRPGCVPRGATQGRRRGLARAPLS